MAKKLTKDTMVFRTLKGWAVKKSDATRASRVYDDKKEAVSYAREQRRKGYDVVIFKKDGGLDEFLPKIEK